MTLTPNEVTSLIRAGQSELATEPSRVAREHLASALTKLRRGQLSALGQSEVETLGRLSRQTRNTGLVRKFSVAVLSSYGVADVAAEAA